jgi:hypothetical protein
MANQIVVSSGAKVRDLNDVIIGTSGVLSSLAFNVANGVPKLDVNGKILVSQLPNSVMEYQGTWNAATNTPTLVNGTGNQGDVYLCNVAGTVNFGAGPIAFFVGDQVIYSGSIWQRASGATGTVTSVAVTESGDSLNITGSPITTSGTINIGFNGTNLQYINGAGDLTTFPALTGYVPYTGATANVDLGTFNLTADVITGATGSFTSNGGSNTFAINHSSGAGIALNITKGGSGEGLYINKTSGSGNAATIVGTLEATTLVKTGGTSSQFLKADGSVDSTSYGTGSVTSVAALTLGTSGTDLSSTVATSTTTPVITLNVPTASATNRGALSSTDWTTFNNKASTADLANYLLLTGGTLSGILNISTASYLTSRLKLINTATGGNSWSLSSGNANNSTNNGLFTIINETLSKNIFVLGPTGKLDIGADLGTINPAYALSVYDTNPVLRVFDLTGNNSSVILQATNTDAYVKAGYATTAIPLLFQTGNTTRLTIAATGESTLTGALNGTSAVFSSTVQASAYRLTGMTGGSGALYWSSDRVTLANYNATGVVNIEANGGTSVATFGGATYNNDFVGTLRNTTSAYFATTSGNVGIGNTAPATKLDVTGTIRPIGQTDPTSGVGMELFYRSADTSSYLQSYDRTNSAWKDVRIYGSTLYFGSQGSNHLTINTAGNVGIGTSSPLQTASNRTVLTINATTSNVLNFGVGGTLSGYIYNDASTTGLYAQGDLYLQADGAKFTAFVNNSVERMRITSGGNVGINNTTPSTYLDVSNNGTNNNAYITTRNTGISGYRSGAIFTNSAAGGLSWYLVSTNNGDGDWGGGKFAISTNNAVGVYLNGSTATTWTGQSDIRLKDIDSEIENAIDKVNKLRGVRFTWKSDETKKMQVGLIAQEVKEVLPEAVDFDETNEDYRMGVQYTDLIPLLVNAIKELSKQNEELSNRLIKLESK